MNTIIQRLQPHTVEIYHLEEDSVEEKWVDARSLLISPRFDLFAKVYYIRMREENRVEAERVYKEHIKAFNPDLKEPGRDDKSGYDDFVSSFDQLIDTFKNQEFDSSKSLVPVTEDGVILDGAHRVAALAYFDRKVGVALCKGVKPKAAFDYNYFKNRGLSWNTMDVIANEMVRWTSNMYVACLWPKMEDKSRALTLIEHRFGVAYEKKLKVNLKSFQSLISRVYDNQPWVSEPDSVKFKSLQCYGFNGQIQFLFFCANSLDEVLTIKEEIRAIYNVGKHSLHITDSIEETRALAKVILDETERNIWNASSAVDGMKEKMEERWCYFKNVQWINIKAKVAKFLKR